MREVLVQKIVEAMEAPLPQLTRRDVFRPRVHGRKAYLESSCSRRDLPSGGLCVPLAAGNTLRDAHDHLTPSSGIILHR